LAGERDRKSSELKIFIEIIFNCSYTRYEWVLNSHL
jgi:hypothetical protein